MLLNNVVNIYWICHQGWLNLTLNDSIPYIMTYLQTYFYVWIWSASTIHRVVSFWGHFTQYNRYRYRHRLRFLLHHLYILVSCSLFYTMFYTTDLYEVDLITHGPDLTQFLTPYPTHDTQRLQHVVHLKYSITCEIKLIV